MNTQRKARDREGDYVSLSGVGREREEDVQRLGGICSRSVECMRAFLQHIHVHDPRGLDWFRTSFVPGAQAFRFGIHLLYFDLRFFLPGYVDSFLMFQLGITTLKLIPPFPIHKSSNNFYFTSEPTCPDPNHSKPKSFDFHPSFPHFEISNLPQIINEKKKGIITPT